MIEAMACGTPVIAWRCGSVPEVVEHGVSGFIVDERGRGGGGGRPARTGSTGAAVRDVFERRFTAEVMARNYLQLYWRLYRGHAQDGRARRRALELVG